MARLARRAVCATLGTRDRTAGRARRALRGRIKTQQVPWPARFAGSIATAQQKQQCPWRRAGHARRTPLPPPGVEVSCSAIATADTSRRKAMMGVSSAILATTTATQTGTSAPSARGGCILLPRAPPESRHACRARLARGRSRAVQTARGVLQIPIHLKRQLFRQIAAAILEHPG